LRLEFFESKVYDESSICINKTAFINKQFHHFGKVSANKNLTNKQVLMLPFIPSTFLMERYLLVLVHIIECHDGVMVRSLLQNVLESVIFHLCGKISIIHRYTRTSRQSRRQFLSAC
jgi:hypothetical protein